MSTKYQKFLNDVSGKKISVIGMGVSNTPLIRLLLSAGACVTIRDKALRSELSEEADIFEAQGARFICGEDYLKNIDDEIIFKTPGMRPDVFELNAARENGSIITSEMEIFFKVCPAKIIGITGSDGKTTTTTIIYELLKAEGYNCFVGGNIGTPLLDKVPEMKESDFCVLELSSFQLMTMTDSPDIAVITNIAPNHLDVHKSMEEYTEAKINLLKHNKDARIVLNLDNDVTREISNKFSSHLFSRRESAEYCVQDGVIYAGGKPVMSVNDIKIPGLHNVENYLAAIAAVDGLVSFDTIKSVAKSFNGVKHRMELVREKDGILFYNDSIASSPTRTIAGLRSFKQKIILIAGGYDKKIPFDVLGPEVIEHVKALILIGKTSDKIEAAVVNSDGYCADNLPIYRPSTFEAAVKKAYEIAERGDIVALSPACASFDLFKNFAERGETFRKIVNSL